MCSQYLCNIAYTAALLTHSLYGLPVLVMQTLVLSFRHVLCSFPSSFAFMVKKISVSEFLRSARSSFLLFPIKKENRQRLYNLLSIFILKLILHFYMEFSLFLAQFAKGSSLGNTIPEEEPSHISFDLFSFKRILICLFYKFLLSLHTALCQYLYILCNIIDQRYDCKYQRYPDQYLCDHVKCTAKICD